MSRYEASTAYWTIYNPSITLGLGLTLTDHNQLDTIHKSMMNTILPKMGYSSKTCQHAVFVSWEYLGIGARDLVTEQGDQQTLILLKHIPSNQDQQTTPNWTQMVPAPRQNWETNSWMLLSWDPIPGNWMVQNNLELPLLYQYWIPRGYDTCPQSSKRARPRADGIIPCTPTHYICNDLYWLNLCRLYLQVEFLSKICNPEGNNILP